MKLSHFVADSGSIDLSLVTRGIGYAENLPRRSFVFIQVSLLFECLMPDPPSFCLGRNPTILPRAGFLPFWCLTGRGRASAGGRCFLQDLWRVDVYFRRLAGRVASLQGIAWDLRRASLQGIARDLLPAGGGPATCPRGIVGRGGVGSVGMSSLHISLILFSN